MAAKITKKTSTHNTTAFIGRAIKYIVIHYTAGVSSAKGEAANTADYFAGTTNQASADFIVDDETIVQYNPDPENRYCWHSGGSRLFTKGGILYGVAKNANSIGIEVCSTNSTGKVLPANDKTWSFTDAVVAKAVELTRYLMEKYSIDADHVIRHYDVIGKPCPGIIGWNADSGDESKWKAFQAAIASREEDLSGSAEPESFQVEVSISNLNIRTGPGTEFAKTGKYTGKGVFTIVETS
ncbi:MAG: N-acetylmuramoyl-L-alanine amidase, partial [Lachnospiraceae bacterium]|nr:N-acetylmuramoyl-L-alanine amidase [Lachnospiraceae bacterium]